MKKLSLSTSFFEDNKIKAISLMKNNDTALLLYLKLLFNCCKEDGDGKLILFGDIPYDEKIISGIYSIPEKTVSECLELLTRFGFITKEDGCYVISNFDEITGKDFRENHNRSQQKYMGKKLYLDDDIAKNTNSAEG